MENIVLHLMLIRGVREAPLVYVVWCHIKVVHISPEYKAHLNLDKEMIARAHIVNGKSNLKFNQKSLDRVYHYQCDTFKIDNALVYHVLLKMFMKTDAHVYMKQKKSTKDG